MEECLWSWGPPAASDTYVAAKPIQPSRVFRDKGAEHSWQLFKDVFLTAQELSIPLCKKAGREGRQPGWLSKDLLVKLRSKKEMHRQWKQGHVAWEEYRDAAQMCRGGIRKAW